MSKKMTKVSTRKPPRTDGVKKQTVIKPTSNSTSRGTTRTDKERKGS